MENYANLPKGWTLVTIGDLINKDGVFVDGDWVESKDQDPNGDVRLIQLADLGDGFFRNRSNRYLTYEKAIELGCTFLKEGDLIIARMPDPLGRACIFPGDPKSSVTVVDVCVVRTGTGGANHRWLMYAINSPQFRAMIESYQSGSTRKRISRKNLAKIQFPLPPFPEQKRIVERIETLFTQLDTGVAGLKRSQAALKRYRASVLKAACEGRLVPQDPNDEPAKALLRQLGGLPLTVDDLSSLPEGWCWTAVGDLASKVTDGTHKTPKYTDDGIPFISVNNISENGVIDFIKTKFISLEEHEELIRHCKPEKGDVLLSKVGTIGLTAVVKTDIAFSLFVNTALIKPKQEIIDADYMAYVLRFGFMAKLYEQKISGSTQKFIGTNKIKQLPIPLPPIDEQHHIVAEVDHRLSVVRELEKGISASLKRATRLRQAILKRAFEGRLV